MLIAENLLWLLILIGVMILVHELGHFWAARYFDVKVEVFSFGFGPRLFGFRRGETDYRFSAILFGGYVKMAGEQPGDEGLDDPRGFLAKPRWQRLIIAGAGPFMNIVLAVALLTGLFMVKYQRVVEPSVRGLVGHVAANSPADRAGIREGDRIVRLAGKENPSWEDIILTEVAGASVPLEVAIERDGRRIETTVTPVLEERSGVGSAGWAERGEVQLGSLSANMPAEKSGLKPGDLVRRVNGQPIGSAIKFHELIRGSKGRAVEIEVEREGRRIDFTVQPVWAKLDGPERWMIGAIVAQKLKIETTRLPFFEAVEQSVEHNIRGATLIAQFLKGIVERRMS
ncbi:MAG: RIP metalloprotease RseP, partial [Acidobacteria bacterium]|nr:RIP metalloprotease RseP [Acidobacteriota bacterium]